MVHGFKPNPDGSDVDMTVPLNRKHFPDFLFELFLDGFSRVRCQRQAEVDLEHSEGEVRSRESIQAGCCCVTKGRRRGGKHYKPYQVTETGEWNVVLRVPKGKAFEGKYKLRRKFILGKDKDNNKIFDGYSFEFVRNDEVYCVKMMRQSAEGQVPPMLYSNGLSDPYGNSMNMSSQQQMLLANSFGNLHMPGGLQGLNPLTGSQFHHQGNPNAMANSAAAPYSAHAAHLGAIDPMVHMNMMAAGSHLNHGGGGNVMNNMGGGGGHNQMLMHHHHHQMGGVMGGDGSSAALMGFGMDGQSMNPQMSGMAMGDGISMHHHMGHHHLEQQMAAMHHHHLSHQHHHMMQGEDEDDTQDDDDDVDDGDGRSNNNANRNVINNNSNINNLRVVSGHGRGAPTLNGDDNGSDSDGGGDLDESNVMKGNNSDNLNVNNIISEHNNNNKNIIIHPIQSSIPNSGSDRDDRVQKIFDVLKKNIGRGTAPPPTISSLGGNNAIPNNNISQNILNSNSSTNSNNNFGSRSSSSNMNSSMNHPSSNPTISSINVSDPTLSSGTVGLTAAPTTSIASQHGHSDSGLVDEPTWISSGTATLPTPPPHVLSVSGGHSSMQHHHHLQSMHQHHQSMQQQHHHHQSIHHQMLGHGLLNSSNSGQFIRQNSAPGEELSTASGLDGLHHHHHHPSMHHHHMMMQSMLSAPPGGQDGPNDLPYSNEQDNHQS